MNKLSLSKVLHSLGNLRAHVQQSLLGFHNLQYHAMENNVHLKFLNRFIHYCSYRCTASIPAITEHYYIGLKRNNLAS